MKLEIENVDPEKPRPEFHRRILRRESREEHLHGAWALFLECGHIVTLIEIKHNARLHIQDYGTVLCVQCRDGKD